MQAIKLTKQQYAQALYKSFPDKILNGQQLAKTIQHKLATYLINNQVLETKTSPPPTLAIIDIGNNPASKIYVNKKCQVGTSLGIRTKLFRFDQPGNLPGQQAVLSLIQELNQNPEIHGILLQLPLPQHLDAISLINAIKPQKDVDGLNALNMGKLAHNETGNYPVACTPAGIIYLLQVEKINISGKNIVIIGASNIVGRPLAMALLNLGATISICHSKTENLQQHTLAADILIVAAGCPNLISIADIKPNAVVIDVGINRLEDNSLVGDVDPEVIKVASKLSPVPGGIGPMTVAMLMYNTVQAYLSAQQIEQNNLAQYILS